MPAAVDAHDHQIREVDSFPRWNEKMKVTKKVYLKDDDGNQLYDEDGEKMFKMTKKPIPVTLRSEMNHLHASNQVKRHLGFLWNQADQCPYFRQTIPQKRDEKTKKLIPHRKIKGRVIDTRANRALSGHTLRTLASGAFASIGAQLDAEAKTLRLETTKEDTKYPYLPTISLGAQYAIEAAWIAYVQEIFSVAVQLKNASSKGHDKVTSRCCQAAAEIVNKRIAQCTGFVPESVAYRKIHKTIKKKKPSTK